jgi:hypothetical protein
MHDRRETKTHSRRRVENCHKGKDTPSSADRGIICTRHKQKERGPTTSRRSESAGDREAQSRPSDANGSVCQPNGADGHPAAGLEPAVPQLESLDRTSLKPLRWLWPERFPLGKIALLTGDAGLGKSLVACDLIARATTGSDWPDAFFPVPRSDFLSPTDIGKNDLGPADVLLIAPDDGLRGLVARRLDAARADLDRVRLLSSGAPTGRRKRQTAPQALKLPSDGPAFESILNSIPNLRLVVIDPLSQFVELPRGAACRESALHDVLAGLQSLAEQNQFALLCIEPTRCGGILGASAGRDWRTRFDPAFQSVWGIARDPVNPRRRLLISIRHHLADDRCGFQFEIVSGRSNEAHVCWMREENSVDFAEAAGCAVVARTPRALAQAGRTEDWLRRYLADGEKVSADIFADARKLGFARNVVRDALHRIAQKFKRGFQGQWSWKLLDQSRDGWESPRNLRKLSEAKGAKGADDPTARKHAENAKDSKDSKGAELE